MLLWYCSCWISHSNRPTWWQHFNWIILCWCSSNHWKFYKRWSRYQKTGNEREEAWVCTWHCSRLDWQQDLYHDWSLETFEYTRLLSLFFCRRSSLNLLSLSMLRCAIPNFCTSPFIAISLVLSNYKPYFSNTWATHTTILFQQQEARYTSSVKESCLCWL